MPYHDDSTTGFKEGDGIRTRPKPKNSRDDGQPIRLSVPIAEAIPIPAVETVQISEVDDLVPAEIPKSPDAPLPKIDPITLNANPQVTVDQFVVILNAMTSAINALQVQMNAVIAGEAAIVKQINLMNNGSKRTVSVQTSTLRQQLAQQAAVIAQQKSLLITIKKMNAS